MKRTHKIGVLASVATLLLTGSGWGQITPGFDFEVNAGLDTDGDLEWEDLTVGNPSGFGLQLDDSPAVTRVAITGSATQLTHAYDFPGGATGNEAGAIPVDTGTTTRRSFAEAPGDWSNNDVTLEMWFKPDNLTPTPANGQILFEDGGGTGLGLFIDNNELVLGHDSNTNLITYNLNTDPLGLLLGAATSDFIQVVLTHDVTSPFQTVLYVNGVQVGTSNDDNDWSGGDDAGFGTRGASNVGGRGGGQSSTESFDGQIALIRIYDQQILTPAEVLANFDEFSGPDVIAPVVTNLTPADDEPGFFAGSDLVVTFDEDIQAGTGNITIKDLDTPTDTVIAIGDATQVTISGDTLTINPTADLSFGTNYAVQIDAGAVTDQAAVPNNFAGILDDTTWNFTTLPLDLTAPVATAFSPTDDNAAVIPNVPLMVTFDEDIQIGTGSITVKNLTDVTDNVIPVGDSQVSISGNVLTVTVTGNLPAGKDIAVQIDATAIENLTGLAYAGIADDTTWNFTTLSATTQTTNGSWTDAGNWDLGVPTTGLDATIDTGITSTANNAVGAWSGTLTLQAGSTLSIEAGSNPNPSPMVFEGATEFFLNDGSEIIDNFKTATFPQNWTITGTAGMDCTNNSGNNHDRIFNGTISGGNWYTDGRNHCGYTYNSANTFSSYEARTTEGNRYGVGFNAPGSAGTGNVTVTTGVTQSAVLILGSDDVFDDSCVLTLNGKGWDNSTGGFGPYSGGAHVGTSIRLRMDGFNDTIDQLFVDDVQYPAGTYSGSGTADFVGQEWISGSGVLTVTTGPAAGTLPTVASITDDKSAGQCYENDVITYTVTFSEEMIGSTVDVADFENGPTGTATITVDSVTEIAFDTYEVVVSPTSLGSVNLQIAAGAVLEDFSRDALDTTNPVVDDSTIDVIAFVPNNATMVVDFQATIASEQHPTYAGEARYYHVSVNPANPGTGSYAATIVGTNNPAPVFVRNYDGDVLSYKFVGGTNNDISAIAASGGDASLITYTTEDVTFDGFGQQQAKIWDATDPGADLATGGADPYAAVSDTNGGGHRSFGGAVGTIDISGLSAGSVHIYYGAFSATPSVRVVMSDSTGLALDVVLADVHLNADNADRTEYYLAEVDFVTDGIYDTIEYEWLADGSGYDGNGRGIGTVLTGPPVVGDYGVWAALYPEVDLTDSTADLDGDGLTNDEERLFGLDPTDPGSVNPYVVGLFEALDGSTFSFTRRDDALTGKFTRIETSTDLQAWTEDTGAALVVTGPDTNGVETVAVTLSPALLTGPKLFVRVVQDDGVLLSADFESDDGGFTFVSTAGSDWAVGAPDSNSLGGFVNEGNGGSANCFGTNLGAYAGGAGDAGFYDVPTTASCLRSSLIDLTGVAAATLTFAEALDLDGGDTAVVNILDAADAVIGAAVYTADDSATQSDANWNSVGPIDLTPYVGQSIKIEWCLTGGGTDFLGWYIDDVTVAETAP